MRRPPIQIIAEAGVNHNGKRDLALRLIDAAAEAGADAVKFQTFKAEKLVSAGAAKAAYQQRDDGSGETQLAMLKRLELDLPDHRLLVDHCQRRGIDFLSTAFDHGSLCFLVDELGLTTLKIPSGELTNGPLLLATARHGQRIIISTGMATLGEIEQALGVVAFGFVSRPNDIPSHAAFRDAYISAEGQAFLRERVVLLHCTTEYPAPLEDVNLDAMLTLGHAFRLDYGYSDHTRGITIPIASAALGASLIEKHFTLDHNLPGPDHKASLEPEELHSMVRAIREVELARRGDGIKGPCPSELDNRDVARRSLVAKKHIAKGDIFTLDNLTTKRPGTGLSPMEYWSLMGQVSTRDLDPDEQV